MRCNIVQKHGKYMLTALAYANNYPKKTKRIVAKTF